MNEKQVNIQREGGSGSGQRPIMLAIAGDSGTGKTTITAGLVEALGHDRIASVGTDDYHAYDREERKGLPFTPLHPKCNYIDIMEQHLHHLSMGQPILKPVYNHDTGTLDRPEYVEPREFVIVEGLFPLFSKVSRACFDITVFLDPPEDIRIAWKMRRDIGKRGYTEDQVRAELQKREPESSEFIRPQRAHADIVVRFSPIEERGETAADPLSAYLLLRPTISHPDLTSILTDDVKEGMHLKLRRDADGKPVDSVHVHSYAKREDTKTVEEAIWAELGVDEPVPDSLGRIDPEHRDEPLAVTQLILLYHLIQARNAVARS